MGTLKSSINIRKSDLRQQGFQLMEMVVVCTVMISIMSLGSRYIQYNLQQSTNQAVAYQLSQVSKAAYQYVQDRYSTFDTPITSITLRELTEAGYLAQHVENNNLYGQQYNIYVEQKSDPAGQVTALQILIRTDKGRAIDGLSLHKIATLVGVEGGYSSITRSGKIVSSMGGWEINGKLDPGHLASLTVVNQKDLIAPYFSHPSNTEEDLLHRVPVDGHSEYNEMRANLTMEQGKNINLKGGAVNVSAVNPKDKSSYLGTEKVNFNWPDENKQTYVDHDMVILKGINNKEKSNEAQLDGNALSLRDNSADGAQTDVKKDRITMYHSGKKIGIDMSSNGSINIKDKLTITHNDFGWLDGLVVDMDDVSLSSEVFHLPGYYTVSGKFDSVYQQIIQKVCAKHKSGAMFYIRDNNIITSYALAICTYKSTAFVITQKELRHYSW